MAYGKITNKQKEILEFIKAEILRKGYPPSVREICEAVSLKSTSSVHSHLETLETLTNKNPNIHYYFIIGADSLFQIEQWHCPEQIFALCTLVCAVRDDYDFEAIKEKGSNLAQSGADILYLNMPKVEISSSDIRKKVMDNLPVIEYVPLKVAKYIKEERLYHEED